MSTKIIDSKKREYIFGPVPSRRLGRSLGLDLVPFKTCTYDCIYCQLGRTTNNTIQRKEWVPIDIVIEQLKEKLDSRPDSAKIGLYNHLFLNFCSSVFFMQEDYHKVLNYQELNGNVFI